MSRILCIDYGEKRIGVAVSDPDRVFSFPLIVLENTMPGILNKLEEIIKEKGITDIVIGYPLRTDGTRSKSCEKIDEFNLKLQEKFPDLKIINWDERFTSKIANDAMMATGINSKKRRNTVDAVAASLILQNYLESIQ
ncbi:MAG: Holliday junction resolvase RuvX [bacterium]|nr:Holliday junction resolvase RuvX [bacterium]